MSEILPVTLVQEVLTPSREITRLIGLLTEEDIQPQPLQLRTSVRKVIPRLPGEAHPSLRYAPEFLAARRTLDKLGKTAFLLGNVTKQSELLHHSSGRARLVMHPRRQEALDELTGVMDPLPTVEMVTGGENYLYIQFAAGALIKDAGRREEALGQFNARLRHPGMRPSLTATNPRLVLQDTAIRMDRPIP